MEPLSLSHHQSLVTLLSQNQPASLNLHAQSRSSLYACEADFPIQPWWEACLRQSISLGKLALGSEGVDAHLFGYAKNQTPDTKVSSGLASKIRACTLSAPSILFKYKKHDYILFSKNFLRKHLAFLLNSPFPQTNLAWVKMTSANISVWRGQDSKKTGKHEETTKPEAAQSMKLNFIISEWCHHFLHNCIKYLYVRMTQSRPLCLLVDFGARDASYLKVL